MRFFTSIALCLLVIACRKSLPTPGPGPTNSPPPSLVQYTKENSGLPSNAVSRVVVDKRGIVWAGTYQGHLAGDSSRGLARFDGTNWRVFNAQNSPLPANGILDLALAPDEALWIATTGGLARFDGSTWRVFTKVNAPFPSNFIVAVDVTTEGHVWVATRVTAPGQNILFLFDGTRWQEQPAPEALTTGEVSDLLVDGKQTLWVGTRLRGLLRRTAQGWTVFRKDTLGMPYQKVGRLHTDDFGDLWLVPYNGLFESSGEKLDAVVRFDGVRFESFLLSPEGYGFFPLSVTTDAAGRPWAGGLLTLSRYDGRWAEFIPKTKTGGGRAFYDLTFEARKRLWAATNEGLIQFVPE